MLKHCVQRMYVKKYANLENFSEIQKHDVKKVLSLKDNIFTMLFLRDFFTGKLCNFHIEITLLSIKKYYISTQILVIRVYSE
jgi:hypothetical protein